MPETTATACVLREVAAVRARQDERWGEQNWPGGTCAKFGRLEALSETAPHQLRRELVRVAAVAANWVDAIDRRTGVAPNESPLTRPPSSDSTDRADSRARIRISNHGKGDPA